MWKLLVQTCRTVYEWLCPVQPLLVGISVSVPDIEFDWLTDYGPLWEPGDKAFWLEPDTCDELASWCSKYRPYHYGRIVANEEVRIDWMEPVPNPFQYKIADRCPNPSKQAEYYI